MEEMNNIMEQQTVAPMIQAQPKKAWSTGQVIGIGAGAATAAAAAATGICMYLNQKDKKKMEAEFEEKIRALKGEQLKEKLDIKKEVTEK